MKKQYLHSAGSIRFSASFINRMLLLCLLGIVMPQAIYSATSYSVQQRETSLRTCRAWQNGATYDVYENNKTSQVYDLQGFA